MIPRLIDYFRQGPIGRNTDVATGARSIFSNRMRWLLLSAFVLLIVFRLPLAWVHGRFQDEEATVFFAYAWHHPWQDALFRPFAGYWNIAANGTTLLVATLVKGGIVSLERAPYLTMIMALAVQVQPAVLILTGSASWLAGRRAVIAALLIVALAPATEEVFFNILHIQFHLALCVGLILALDVPRRRIAKFGYSLILFLAPLCGPAAIILLPLFILRGVADRDWRRLVQATPLVVGAAIQMLLFYSASPMRSLFPAPDMIAAALFVRLIALPIVNGAFANDLGAFIYLSRAGWGVAWWCSVIATVVLFGTLLVVASRKRDASLWLALSGLFIAIATFGFGFVTTDDGALFNVYAGERYGFLPITMLAMSLIVLAMRPQFPGKLVYGTICLAVLISGASTYLRPDPDFEHGPSWTQQVAEWRRDHNHPMAVWPKPWTADLSDRRHSCSPVDRIHPIWSDEPRYCESGWVSGFLPKPQSTGR